MKFRGCSNGSSNVILLLLFVAVVAEGKGPTPPSKLACTNRWSPCYRRVIRCPGECPYTKPSDPKAKACFLDCNSPKCEAVCRGRKPKCDGLGSGCYDPRFIGRDGVVFYFHGRKDEHFALVSDPNVHINARFIGIRPVNRSRDFTWIQALGLVYGNDSHMLTIEATRAAKWDDSIDHLSLSYNGKPVTLPENHLAEWKSADNRLTVERTGSRQSIVVSVEDVAEISLNVVPITEEDDKIHEYGIPSDDCFAHLEVQFQFYGLSPEVDGVLGRTYRDDYVSTVKAGVAMPVVGGEDKYRTTSLLSSDCKVCFSPVVADE